MKTLTLLTPILSLCLISSAFAAQENSEYTTKEQYIEHLQPKPAPKPRYKLRGIKINGAEPAPVAAEPPSISMRVNFAFDSYVLTEEIKAQLQPLGEALMSEQLQPYSFEIAGHTDSVGHEEYNRELSGKRAVSVGQYLYDRFGVQPERLSLLGHGEEQLLDAGDPKSGANRRVEITTLVTEG